MNILTAKNACTIAQKYNKDKSTVNIDGLLKRIIRFSKVGLMSATFRYKLNEKEIKALKDLGYNVYFECGTKQIRNTNWFFNKYDIVNHTYTIITWGNPVAEYLT